MRVDTAACRCPSRAGPQAPQSVGDGGHVPGPVTAGVQHGRCEVAVVRVHRQHPPGGGSVQRQRGCLHRPGRVQIPAATVRVEADVVPEALVGLDPVQPLVPAGAEPDRRPQPRHPTWRQVRQRARQSRRRTFPSGATRIVSFPEPLARLPARRQEQPGRVAPVRPPVRPPVLAQAQTRPGWRGHSAAACRRPRPAACLRRPSPRRGQPCGQHVPALQLGVPSGGPVVALAPAVPCHRPAPQRGP